jgi:uncharacterized membrane protein
MAARKPTGRANGTRQQQQKRTSAARAGATASAKSARNGAASGTSRASASGAGRGKSGSGAAPRTTAAQRTPASRSATAVEPAKRSGPLGRLLSPLTSMGWLPLATFVLSLYGLGASVYLTLAHYDTSIHLACADNGLVNCEAVTTSPESILFGIFPVAVLGLAFYVLAVAINSPWGWRLSASQPAVRWIRLGSVVVGMCFVLYLIYAELIEINAICLWCTSVHVATFLIFALVVYRASVATPAAAAAKR